MKGNDEEDNKAINIEFTEQKAGLENNENAIDFRLLDV